MKTIFIASTSAVACFLMGLGLGSHSPAKPAQVTVYDLRVGHEVKEPATVYWRCISAMQSYGVAVEPCEEFRVGY